MTRVKFWGLLALVPLLAVAQDKPKETPTTGVERDINSYLASIKQPYVDRLANSRAGAEDAVKGFESLLTKRTEFIEQLKRGLQDGDETLIEVATDNIHRNRLNIDQAIQRMDSRGEPYIDAARRAYRMEAITEQEYVSDLTYYRQMKNAAKQAAPAELAELVQNARSKIPRYFARLQEQGETF